MEKSGISRTIKGIVLVMILVCLAGSVSATWWNTNWYNRIIFTEENIIGSTLTAQVLYANFSIRPSFGNFSSFRVLDSANKELNISFDFNNSNQVGIWFTDSSFETGTNTYYLYYNNSLATPVYNTSRVFGNDAVLIWHMNNATAEWVGKTGVSKNFNNYGSSSSFTSSTLKLPLGNTFYNRSFLGVMPTNRSANTVIISARLYTNTANGVLFSQGKITLNYLHSLKVGNTNEFIIYSGLTGGDWSTGERYAINKTYNVGLNRRSGQAGLVFRVNSHNTSEFGSQSSWNSNISNSNFYVGSYAKVSGSYQYNFTGEIYEIQYYKADLSNNTVKQLLQNFNSSNFKKTGEQSLATLNQIRVTNYRPRNNAVVNGATNVYLACNASVEGGGSNIIALDLWASDSASFPVYSIVASNRTSALRSYINFSLGATPEDTYYYTCNASNATQHNWATNNFTFTVDNTNPTFVSITNLINVTKQNGQPQSIFHYNMTDKHISKCYYNSTQSTAYTTLTKCNDTITITWNSLGTKKITMCGNDTAGNKYCRTRGIRVLNFSERNSIIKTIYGEGEKVYATLYLNFTSPSEFYTYSSANLTINQTVYSTPITKTLGSNYIKFNTSYTIPNTWGSIAGTTKYLNWTYNIRNSTKFFFNNRTIKKSILIYENSMNISTGCGKLNKVFYFYFRNESSARETLINASIDYDLVYSFSESGEELNISGSKLITNNLTICINGTTYPEFWIKKGELHYKKSGYSERRYYLFETKRYTNTTYTIPLYLLRSGSSTSFLFTIQNYDLSKLSDKYIALNHWFPNLNEYETVEMAKTDTKGQTIMKVITEDVDYRVGVYYRNGTLIYLASPFRLACLASPCSYTLNVPRSSLEEFNNWLNMQASLTYNATTGIFTFIYTDPSQQTDNYSLKVFRETGISSTQICSTSDTGYTGVLTCNTAGYTGTLRAVGYRSASPNTPIITKIISTNTAGLTGSSGLFITLIILISLTLIGLASPIMAIILAVVAFIPAVLFKIIPLAIMLLIGVLGFIVIFMMRRSNQ